MAVCLGSRRDSNVKEGTRVKTERYLQVIKIATMEEFNVKPKFWENGPEPGQFYEFPGKLSSSASSAQRTL